MLSQNSIYLSSHIENCNFHLIILLIFEECASCACLLLLWLLTYKGTVYFTSGFSEMQIFFVQVSVHCDKFLQ